LPPLQAKTRGRGTELIPPCELVAKTNDSLPAQRRVAKRVLVLFVEKIGCPPINREATMDEIAGRKIEACVPRVARVAQAEKIAVGDLAGEIAGKRGIETMKGAHKSDGAGV